MGHNVLALVKRRQCCSRNCADKELAGSGVPPAYAWQGIQESKRKSSASQRAAVSRSSVTGTITSRRPRIRQYMMAGKANIRGELKNAQITEIRSATVGARIATPTASA
mmetsp:Transcript_114965/g.320274  ORF Transcript_114965/g.320274 Transcript_114965/m.320274 type:complete len:109 (+) Transcript_114965:37-363(+)